MAAPEPLRLSEEVDPWERQPAETGLRHRQFLTYRDLGRVRTLAGAAQALDRSDGYVRQVAAAHLWVPRAEAWDAHLDAQYRKAWVTERIRAAEDDARILRSLTGKVAARLASLNPESLSVSEFLRLVDVVLRHRRALFGNPLDAAPAGELTGHDPMAAELAEFADLPPAARKRRLLELTEQAEARAAALSGLDDE